MDSENMSYLWTILITVYKMGVLDARKKRLQGRRFLYAFKTYVEKGKMITISLELYTFVSTFL